MREEEEGAKDGDRVVLKPAPSVQVLPVRLLPGADLRRALEDRAASERESAFVVCGIGSLQEAKIRYAGAQTETTIAGPLEVLTLSGSLSASGAHLHVSVSDAAGRVYGGHLCYGSIVRTTAEVALAWLADWSLGRELDPRTGFLELVVRRRAGAQSAAADSRGTRTS